MLRHLFFLFLATISSTTFATCQLGERCDYLNNDIDITKPYVGTYKCTLEPANNFNLELNVSLLVKNTIGDPAQLILDDDHKIGIMKISARSGDKKNLKNAFRIDQTSTSTCDGSKGQSCDVKPTIMCERISD